MRQIVSEVILDDGTLRRLSELPGVQVHMVSSHTEGAGSSRGAADKITPPAAGAHEKGWEIPDDLVDRTEVLLTKRLPRNLDRMSGLKFIQLSTVGYEHLRRLELWTKPFRVCNARGIFDTAIAEWNVAMMIDLARDLRGMIRNQEQGNWDRADRFHQEVRGRIVGLWGYGGIGRESARLAKALGMTVHVMTRSGIRRRDNSFTWPGTGDPPGVLPDRAFILGQETEFLSQLDFLILALPHTQQSSGMIGEKELQMLPRSALLLNPARGGIVQQEALLPALREGWIAGAAIDTHYAYPLPTDHPLWRFPNVILTPHISGADGSSAFPSRIGELFMQNLTRYVEGRPLLNELTAQEWRET